MSKIPLYERTIPPMPHVQDHCYQSQPVLPAVEALQILADEVKNHFPSIDVSSSSNARFWRFLFLSTPATGAPVWISLEQDTPDSVQSVLLSRMQPKNTAFTRMREHVSVTFGRQGGDSNPQQEPACLAGGEAFIFSAEQLYADLVPFGPAFQTVQGMVTLTSSGGTAELSASVPLHLDAAFHVACAWGQRYAGFVAFPSGYERRRLISTPQPREIYRCHVTICEQHAHRLLFDLQLSTREGEPVEYVHHLEMTDISLGKLPVPQWIECCQLGSDLPT